MSTDLERRYARVLRLYPAAYRRERGPELLATLLDAAPEGRRRPSTRELTALVLGALRAHAGAERRSLRDSWLTACRTAALLILVSAVAAPLVSLAVQLAIGVPVGWGMFQLDLPDLVALPFGLIAIVAVLRGHHRVAAVATVPAAGAVGVAAWLVDPDAVTPLSWYPIAGALLIPLFGKAPRPATGILRYLPLIALVEVGTDMVSSNAYTSVTGAVSVATSAAVVLGALLWVVVDERVTMAVGLVCLCAVAVRIAGLTYFAVRYDGAGLTPDVVGYTMLVATVGPALLLSASALALRRRVRV